MNDMKLAQRIGVIVLQNWLLEEQVELLAEQVKELNGYRSGEPNVSGDSGDQKAADSEGTDSGGL